MIKLLVILFTKSCVKIPRFKSILISSSSSLLPFYKENLIRVHFVKNVHANIFYNESFNDNESPITT